jgi:23S rRNA (pseudouridine1915-N3)-methyltransferase
MPQVMPLNLQFIFIGKMKSSSPFLPLWNDYTTRLQGKLDVIELTGQSTEDEQKKILSKLDSSAAVIVLDETGTAQPSTKFAKTLEALQLDKGKIQFVIGGADGLSDEIRKQADTVISFGRQTWPHMMVRVMLVEQIYRAQQILANHPYHRE